MDVHYSSKRSDWETPQIFFNELNKKFNFDVDVCANTQNRKCEIWYDQKIDCLKTDWTEAGKRFFMNPPYGRQIGKFVEKAYFESLKGLTVVCLLPSRTDTKWFHDYVKKGEIEFIRGRLVFELNGEPILDKNGRPQPAPFPSLTVTF